MLSGEVLTTTARLDSRLRPRRVPTVLRRSSDETERRCSGYGADLRRKICPCDRLLDYDAVPLVVFEGLLRLPALS